MIAKPGLIEEIQTEHERADALVDAHLRCNLEEQNAAKEGSVASRPSLGQKQFLGLSGPHAAIAVRAMVYTGVKERNGISDRQARTDRRDPEEHERADAPVDAHLRCP